MKIYRQAVLLSWILWLKTLGGRKGTILGSCWPLVWNIFEPSTLLIPRSITAIYLCTKWERRSVIMNRMEVAMGCSTMLHWDWIAKEELR